MIHVLIADDHTIVRSGVRLLLEAEPDIHVVGEAVDGAQAVELATSLTPHVVLMDIAMPGVDGLEATRQIKSSHPDIQILVLTMHRSQDYFFEILKAGASGYLLKGANPGDLIKAVKVVHRGEVFLYPTMAQKLLNEYLDQVERLDHSGPQLSPREIELMRLVAEGYSYKEIAEKLFVSPSTIHTHTSNLMIKLGLSNRRELIQFARKHGLMKDM